MNPTTKPHHTVACAIEFAEAESALSQHSCTNEAVRARLGLRWARIGGGVLVVTTKSRNLYFNRLIASGLRYPLNDGVLHEACWQAREWGASGLSVEVSDVTRGDDLPRLLDRHGFAAAEPGAKLWRGDVPCTPAPRPAFSVRRMPPRPAQADRWIDVVAQVWRTFGSRRDWYRSRVLAPGWLHYVAWQEDEPIGAAALSVREVELASGERVKVGHLVDGVTLRHARRRGVQAALVRRRLRDGVAEGCRWFTSETAPPLPRRPLVSYRNLLRQGFELACLRRSWSVRWK